MRLLVAASVLALGAAVTGCAGPQTVAEAPLTAAKSGSSTSARPAVIGQLDRRRESLIGTPKHVVCINDDCGRTQKVVTLAAASGAARKGAQKSATTPSAPAAKTMLQIPFAYDQATLDRRALALLAEHLPLFRAAKRLELVGLADSLDRDAYNLKLAERRQVAVRDWLDRQLDGQSSRPVLTSSVKLVRVTVSGEYPPGEAFKGRRVDITGLQLEVQQ